MYPYTATLDVDLTALRANYCLLRSRHAGHTIAAVVKANAYGLGVEAVSRALLDEGCKEFFVATLAEGIELRQFLPQAPVGVFEGFLPGSEPEYAAHRLTPVLNDLAEIARAEEWQRQHGVCPVIIHVDTGMTRLGLTQSDVARIGNSPLLPHAMLMSHLACANEPGHPKNEEQLLRFRAAQAALPAMRTSFANSSGLFLGKEFHGDLGRPGCALYGINPTESENPMRHAATLSAPVLQIRTLDREESIGYGATAQLPKGGKVAIVALGYADGWQRAHSNRGHAWIAGQRVPILGRVSMDMTALDVSALPDAQLNAATRAEFINAQQTVDDVAAALGTIGYEVFTGIGQRVRRVYHG